MSGSDAAAAASAVWLGPTPTDPDGESLFIRWGAEACASPELHSGWSPCAHCCCPVQAKEALEVRHCASLQVEKQCERSLLTGHRTATNLVTCRRSLARHSV